MINADTIEKLIQIYDNDNEILTIIKNTLTDFEKYHHAIYQLEHFIMFKTSDISPEKYRSSFSELDNARTVQHNLVLAGVGILNKLAEKNGLAPVYTGIISKEQPYRREVADAVMEYIEYIIRKRI